MQWESAIVSKSEIEMGLLEFRVIHFFHQFPPGSLYLALILGVSVYENVNQQRVSDIANVKNAIGTCQIGERKYTRGNYQPWRSFVVFIDDGQCQKSEAQVDSFCIKTGEEDACRVEAEDIDGDQRFFCAFCEYDTKFKQKKSVEDEQDLKSKSTRVVSRDWRCSW